MEITATLIEKNDTQHITDKFSKREFVVEYAENPQYPEFLKFEVVQDNCDLLDNIAAGQNVTIHFNLKGRKWVDKKSGEIKYFNSLQAWKIATNNQVNQDTQMTTATSVQGDEEDGLPF